MMYNKEVLSNKTRSTYIHDRQYECSGQCSFAKKSKNEQVIGWFPFTRMEATKGPINSSLGNTGPMACIQMRIKRSQSSSIGK